MIFNNLLCRGIYHLHLYKFTSHMAITRSNEFSFSNHLPNAAKIPIFTRELIVGENSSKDIRLAKSNLLMLSLKIPIPPRIQIFTVRLPTVQLRDEILNKLELMFDLILKYVTRHSAFCFLNMSNAHFL